jgi:hypothetical protein
MGYQAMAPSGKRRLNRLIKIYSQAEKVKEYNDKIKKRGNCLFYFLTLTSSLFFQNN